MRLNDDERARWTAAETAADRKAIIREVRRRERAERSEQDIEDAVVRSLRRWRRHVDKAVPA